VNIKQFLAFCQYDLQYVKELDGFR